MILTQSHNLGVSVDPVSVGERDMVDTNTNNSAHPLDDNNNGDSDPIYHTPPEGPSTTVVKKCDRSTTTTSGIIDTGTPITVPAVAAYQRRNHHHHHHHSSVVGVQHGGGCDEPSHHHQYDESRGIKVHRRIPQLLESLQRLPTILQTMVTSFSSSSTTSTSSLAAAAVVPPPPSSPPQQQQHQQKIVRRTTWSIGALSLLYLYVLYRTQYILDKHEEYFHGGTHGQLLSGNSNHQAHPPLLRRPNHGKQAISNVQMIPISPIEMIRHSEEVQHLVHQNLQQQAPISHQDGTGSDRDLQRTKGDERSLQVPSSVSSNSHEAITSSNTKFSREPRQYLKYLQSLALDMKRTTHTWRSVAIDTTTTTTISDTDLFIIYNADIPGQGTGNLMAGLLAAHLLGDEFHRIVCINPHHSNSDFLNAFESIDPVAKIKCPQLLQQQSPKRLHMTGKEDVSLINFAGAADECALQNTMSDTNRKVIYVVANTYPRWPTVPNYYFLYYYQPTKRLLEALPYTIQPTTVVHLRQPDHPGDIRSGLDDDSLNALRKLVPSNSSTFLVTNNVDFYKRFADCCHWSHPQWNIVQHSALTLTWGAESHGSWHVVSKDGVEAKPDTQKEQQSIQMWVDWYSILMADDVYHTHSDFSISAIHWMNKKDHSFSIRGYNRETQRLETQIESWWADGETIPVVQRTIQGQPGTTNELRACSTETQKHTERREHRRRDNKSS